MSSPIRVVVKTASVQIGDAFECVVLLDPKDERVKKAKAVYVRLERRVVGDGFDRKNSFCQQAFREPLRMEFHFRCVTPSLAGVSWDGKIGKVTWWVVAEVDVPWAIDPRVEAKFELVPLGKPRE